MSSTPSRSTGSPAQQSADRSVISRWPVRLSGDGFRTSLLQSLDHTFGTGLTDPRHHDCRRILRELAGGHEVEPGRLGDDGDDGHRAGSDHLKDDLAPPRLGERGQGFRQFLAVLDDGRIAISALAVGLAQACLDHSLQYANDRHTFGAPIGSRQALAFALSDLAVSVEAARLLTYKAAALKDAARPAKQIKQAAAIAKLYSTEAAVSATRVATQVFGGNGFMEDYPVARFYRDAKILEIGEGTSEVQRMVIARGLGLPVE